MSERYTKHTKHGWFLKHFLQINRKDENFLCLKIYILLFSFIFIIFIIIVVNIIVNIVIIINHFVINIILVFIIAIITNFDNVTVCFVFNGAWKSEKSRTTLRINEIVALTKLMRVRVLHLHISLYISISISIYMLHLHHNNNTNKNIVEDNTSKCFLEM